MKHRRSDPHRGVFRAREATTAIEFAICAMAIVLLVVGFAEFGRIVWTYEVLQEVAAESARCMGLRANACASAGVYNLSNTLSYVVSLTKSHGVAIQTSMVSLSNVATCGGAAGFSQVSINYDLISMAPRLLTSLRGGMIMTASACFPNNG